MKHRSGVFANVKRTDIWTAEEEAELSAMAGKYNADEIGRRIGRSRDAVRTRATVMGVSTMTTDWTLDRVRKLFGVSSVTIRRAWLVSGLIPARKLPERVGSLLGQWRIQESDLEAFIRECPWAYDPNTMFPVSHPLAQLAVRIHRRDRWLTCTEAGEALGLSASAVQRWCAVGVIPHQRRLTGPGARLKGHIVIRERDLDAVTSEIRRRQHKSANVWRHNFVQYRSADAA